MRRRAVLLFVLLLSSLAPPGAVAQEPSPSVRLRLVEQSGLASPRDPLRISVEATNTGEAPIGSLGMTLTVYYPARSRSELRQGLDEEGPAVAELLVFPVAVRGRLDPGERRTLVIQRRLRALATIGETALYPIKVQLDSEGFAVGSVRSSLVYVHERPEVPLDVSFAVVLDEGVPFLPDGSFRDDRLERTLSPGGRLETLVAALDSARIRMTVAVSPLLLQGLERMSAGYRVRGPGGRVREVAVDELGAERAAAMLERLRELARRSTVEVVALPLASPPVPAMVSARLVRDLDAHIVRGRTTLEALLPGARVSALSPFRPPRGLLNQRSVRALVRLGVDGLMLDPGALGPAGDEVLTAPGVASIPLGRRRSIEATAPDQVIRNLLMARRGEPRLLAQRILGELSAIFLERPGTRRGVSILVREGPAPNPATLSRVLTLIHRSSRGAARRAGWIRPVVVSDLLSGPAERVRRRVGPQPLSEFSPAFVLHLRRTREAISRVASLADETAALAQRLVVQLLLAESAQFVDRERDGAAFLRAIQTRVQRELDHVKPPAPNSAITLTSREGVIPVTLSSTADYAVHLRVTLSSPRLEFVDGASRDIVLDRPRQALTFPVLAQTTGRFPVRVLIQTPDGKRIAESRIVVRSTAYNTRALVVTMASALFLLFLWWRRVQSART